MIPQEEIERVREAADIVSIIGEHVKLRRSGGSWRGPCPFHQGAKPNFSVTPKTGGYKCFVCGESGNVFTFLQKRLGMDFPSAVRFAADKAGIEIHETSARREGPDPREPLWEVNGAAAEFFTAMLWREDVGGAARQYLTSRSITREVADRFGLGYAPRDPSAMRDKLGALGYDDARLLEAGLLVRREDSDETRPRFRDRLIFPIQDVGGHTVGFGGRLIGPGDVKYLNSADSPVFHKGRLLYGLHWAKGPIRREERAILVEGYFDLIRTAAAGIEEVVAPLGTALTEDQAVMLARYTKSVYLLYDSDEAGQRATFRAADVLLAQGLAVQVVVLPEGEDPDTFVARQGGDALRARLAAATDVFERKIELLRKAGWFDDLRRKRRAIDRLLPTIRATADAVTRELYVANLAAAAGIGVETVVRELEEGRGRRRAPDRGPAPEREPESAGPGAPPPEDERRADEDRRMRMDPAERDLLRVLLHSRQHVELVGERLDPAAIRHPALRAVLRALIGQPELGAAELEDVVGEEHAPVVAELIADEHAIVDPDRTLDDTLTRVQVRHWQRQNLRLQRLLPLAAAGEKDEIVRRIAENAEKIRARAGRGARWLTMKKPA